MLSVVRNQRLKHELHKHWPVLLVTRLSVNLLFRVVIVAPEEFLQDQRVHSKLLGQLASEYCQIEGPTVECRREGNISLFWAKEQFILSLLKCIILNLSPVCCDKPISFLQSRIIL